MPCLIALVSLSQRHTVFLTTLYFCHYVVHFVTKNSLMISRAKYHGSGNQIHHIRDLKQYGIIILDLLRHRKLVLRKCCLFFF